MENLIMEIYNKMDIFRKSSSCGRRQYFASAKALYDIELRLEEIENFGEIDKHELEEMSRKADVILQNCGIVYRVGVKV